MNPLRRLARLGWPKEIRHLPPPMSLRFNLRTHSAIQEWRRIWLMVEAMVELHHLRQER